MGLLDGIKKMVTQDPSSVLAQENDLALKRYSLRIERINALEGEYESLSNDQLALKTEEFRKKIKGGASLDSVLVEAFAVVREVNP